MALNVVIWALKWSPGHLLGSPGPLSSSQGSYGSLTDNRSTGWIKSNLPLEFRMAEFWNIPSQWASNTLPLTEKLGKHTIKHQRGVGYGGTMVHCSLFTQASTLLHYNILITALASFNLNIWKAAWNFHFGTQLLTRCKNSSYIMYFVA